MSESGHEKVTIRTSDSDVVVLSVGYFHCLDLTELWIAYGTARSKLRYRALAVFIINKFIDISVNEM